jgi:hypothetical protein
MSRQYFQEPLVWITSDGTPVANTTTETSLITDPSIPANYMADGRLLRLRAFGKLSTTGTPTITFALRYNGQAGTLLATSEALTNGSGVANVNWDIEAYIQTRSNGSAGSLLVWGAVRLHTAAATVLQNVFSVSGYDAPAAVGSLNLTTAWPLALTADWSAASSSNTATLMFYLLESLN